MRGLLVSFLFLVSFQVLSQEIKLLNDNEKFICYVSGAFKNEIGWISLTPIEVGSSWRITENILGYNFVTDRDGLKHGKTMLAFRVDRGGESSSDQYIGDAFEVYINRWTKRDGELTALEFEFIYKSVFSGGFIRETIFKSKIAPRDLLDKSYNYEFAINENGSRLTNVQIECWVE